MQEKRKRKKRLHNLSKESKLALLREMPFLVSSFITIHVQIYIKKRVDLIVLQYIFRYIYIYVKEGEENKMCNTTVRGSNELTIK